MEAKDNFDEGPRVMVETIKKHMEFLVDRIDPEFGLLDKLLANRILTRADVNRIKFSGNTIEDKNRVLLDCILKNMKANELISALTNSGQIHLANYLNADGGYSLAYGDDWPLNESEINRLEINRRFLVDHLDTSDLCNRLFSERVINNRQKQFILSKPNDTEKNEALMDMLTKFSRRQYIKTVACLNDSNQKYMADALSRRGGVPRTVHLSLEAADGNVDKLEDEIVARITELLKTSSFHTRKRLLEEIQKRFIAARR